MVLRFSLKNKAHHGIIFKKNSEQTSTKLADAML